MQSSLLSYGIFLINNCYCSSNLKEYILWNNFLSASTVFDLWPWTHPLYELLALCVRKKRPKTRTDKLIQIIGEFYPLTLYSLCILEPFLFQRAVAQSISGSLYLTGSFCVFLFVCFFVCVCFHHSLQFPPTFQRHASQVY